MTYGFIFGEIIRSVFVRLRNTPTICVLVEKWLEVIIWSCGMTHAIKPGLIISGGYWKRRFYPFFAYGRGSLIL